MKLPLLPGVNRSLKFLLLIVVAAPGSNNVRAQEIQAYEPSPPAVELLALAGSKPTLSPSGAGISSIKVSHLYGRGVTEVKPFDLPATMPLPAGYSLFNKFAFIIESKAVFSGPNDVTFRVPSVTKSAFDNLRILYADRDAANPHLPRWIDATLMADSFESSKEYLPKEEFEKRLPDFTARTLHAFLWPAASLFVVAIKDPAVARDGFSADLILSGEAPEQAMEGRKVTYNLKIANLGPDAATDVRLHATAPVPFEFVSVSAGGDKCRHEGGNIYCKFAKIDKGESVPVKIVQRVRWNYDIFDPARRHPEYMRIDVESAEPDSVPDNNRISIPTMIMLDSNQAPVAQLVSPKNGDMLVGPAATVNLVVKASDPDGFISKTEFFDKGEPLGEGKLTRNGQFELVYKNVSFGRHWLSVKVTDNLGRETDVRGGLDFFVNGRAKINITSPTSGHLQNRADREMIVNVQASHPELKIKEVFVAVSDGSDAQKALPISGDEYSVRVRQNCEYRCELKAIAIDEAGVETLSETVVFTIAEAPEVTLYQYDGETFHKLSEDGQFESSRGLTLAAEAKHESYQQGKVVKMEFFLDEKSICSYDTTDFGGQSYPAMPCSLKKVSPGRYRVHAVATDNDGSVGKSAQVLIEIKKR